MRRIPIYFDALLPLLFLSRFLIEIELSCAQELKQIIDDENAVTYEILVKDGKKNQPFSFLSREKIENFRRDHHIKKDAMIHLQNISSKKIYTKSKIYDIDENLVPEPVFKEGAKYIFEGVQQELPSLNSVYSKDVGNENVLVFTDTPEKTEITDEVEYKVEDLHIKSIIIRHRVTGKSIHFSRISLSNYVARIDDEDIDFDELSTKYRFEEEFYTRSMKKKLNQKNPYLTRNNIRTVPKTTTISERSNDVVSGTSMSVIKGFREEEEEGGCNNMYKMIDLAVAYESSFCQREGGKTAAENTVLQIVASVSQKYQQFGVCAKVRLSHLEGWCDKILDPYKTYVALNSSGCKSYGLLDGFKDIWNSQRQYVYRDTAHLFSGTGLECKNGGCVIGCGYIESMCSDTAYGVNFVSFSKDLQMKSVLVAHEMGHNLGSSHDTSTSYIMHARVTQAASGFSIESITTFQRNVYSCIVYTSDFSDCCINNNTSSVRHFIRGFLHRDASSIKNEVISLMVESRNTTSHHIES